MKIGSRQKPISISMAKALFFVVIMINCFTEIVSCQWAYIGDNNLYWYDIPESGIPMTNGNLDEYEGENCVISDVF
jgi:hypothetical protein